MSESSLLLRSLIGIASEILNHLIQNRIQYCTEVSQTFCYSFASESLTAKLFVVNYSRLLQTLHVNVQLHFCLIGDDQTTTKRTLIAPCLVEENFGLTIWNFLKAHNGLQKKEKKEERIHYSLNQTVWKSVIWANYGSHLKFAVLTFVVYLYFRPISSFCIQVAFP